MWLGQYHLEFGYVLRHYGWSFADGALTTLWISAAILSLSLIVGLAAGLGRVSRNKVLYTISSIYVEIMRDIPLLVMLFFFYFALPELGLLLNQYLIGIAVLALHTGGYIAEIFRAGIQNVTTEQRWSARALGLSRRQTLWRVVLPQIKGDVLPALVNQFIYTIKDTPMLAFIFIPELMYQTYNVQTDTWKVIEVYTIAALIYEFFSFTLGWIATRVERRFKRYRQTTS